MEGKYGILWIFVLLIEVQEYNTYDLYVYIKKGAVHRCSPKNCSLQCGNETIIRPRIFKYVSDEPTAELGSNTTALLYEACSGKQSCSVTKIEGFQDISLNQPDGNYHITYGCPGLKKIYDICNASFVSVGSNRHFWLNTSKDYRAMRSCRCRVTGHFNLRLIDVRLNDDNQRCSNSILTVRQTNETQPLKKVTCFSSPEFNKVIWTGKRADVFISLSDVSNSFLPAMVWIRVEGKEDVFYDVNCSTTINTETTAGTKTSAESISISTLSPPTIWSTDESSEHVSIGTSPKLSIIGTTLPIQSSSNTGEYTKGFTAMKRDQEESSFPVIAVIIPVLVAVVAVVSISVIIVYWRKRRRGKKRCENNTIMNAAYTGTSYETSISTLDGTLHLHSNEKFPQGTTENQAPDMTYDDQYTIISSAVDNEYNQINFSASPIPFDSNYGHIHSTNTVDKNYAHLAGVAGSDSDPYTYTSTEGVMKDKNACNNLNLTSANDAKLEANEDDPNYDHMGSKGNKDARNKLGRTDDNNFDTDLPKGVTKTEILDNANTATHPYFILQPTDNLEARIQNDINEKIDIANAYNNGGQNIASKDILLDSVSELHDTAHQYFTLQPNTDKDIDVSTNFKVDDKDATNNVYSNCESNSHRPISETYFDLERNNVDSMHQYSALDKTTGSSSISIDNGVDTDTTHDYFVLETDSQKGK